MRALGHIFFQVNPRQAYLFVRVPNVLLSVFRVGQVVQRYFTVLAERQIILRDLIVLRHIRIEVVFPIKLTDRRNIAFKDQAG